MPGFILLALLQPMSSSVNFVSTLNAPNSIVTSLHSSKLNISSSVSEIKRSLSNNLISLRRSRSTRVSVRRIKGGAVNDGPLQITMYPPFLHPHPSGHSIVTLAGRITNHSQNIKTAVANRRDTTTTVSLDGMTRCCNLHKERN